MATEVNLPELGESVTEGTVTRWLKQVGDEVAVDEPLLEVSTDKVDTEIPSPVAGTLLEIKAQEDDTVEVGAVLAVIGRPTRPRAALTAAPAAVATPRRPSRRRGAEPTRREPAPEPGQDDAAQTPLDEEQSERDEADAEAERGRHPRRGRLRPSRRGAQKDDGSAARRSRRRRPARPSRRASGP